MIINNMPVFTVTSESDLGFSHSGSVSASGTGVVELSDKEVTDIVALIREKGTSDVEEMGLAGIYPEIYEKLYDACRAVAVLAEEVHWLWEGFYEGVYEYDRDELMEYCELDCGFVFHPESDEEMDEEDFEDAKSEAFDEWLEEYLQGLDDEEFVSFVINRMGAELNYDCIAESFSVGIPEAIIEMAE